MNILYILLLVLLLVVCLNMNNQENYEVVYTNPCKKLTQQESEFPIVDNLTTKYMTVTEFTQLTNEIKELIVKYLVEKGRKCHELNGTNIHEMNEKQLTLLCYSSVDELSESIILIIANHIIDYCRKRYNINVNPYYIITVFSSHLDLAEKVLYPLMNSQLYTLHGIQYFTQDIARKLVSENLYTNDVLYTVLTSRGIVVVLDNDKNVRQ